MRKPLNKTSAAVLMAVLTASMILSGCSDKDKKHSIISEIVDNIFEESGDEEKVEEEKEEDTEDGKKEDDGDSKEEKSSEPSKDELIAKENEKIDKLLEEYYENELIKEYGYIELPAGYEANISEYKVSEGVYNGRAYFDEEGIVYQNIWDYDKDGYDELMVLYFTEDKTESSVRRKPASKLYTNMYEVIGKDVALVDTLESFHYWMQYDIYQMQEVLLKETKDWIFICESAMGTSSIYQDGVSYVIRVAHYNGKHFEVDVAKQLSGSEFSDVKDEVENTARLLRNVTFDKTADHLDYTYKFDRGDDLMSVFYMTGEPSGSMDRYFKSLNIADVPPFLFRLYKDYDSAD